MQRGRHCECGGNLLAHGSLIDGGRMKFADRVERISPSQTLAITNRVLELKRRGEDVIGLGAGEPDFDTPEHIKEAAIRAIREGKTKYTQSTGIPELKEAITERFFQDYDVRYSPEQVIVSCGAKHSLANAVFSVADRGDEVIIFSPYWVTYPELVKLAGANPVVVPANAQDGFAIDLERLRRAITPKTRAILFNNPVNPTGVLYGEESLAGLADLVANEDLYLIADEIYAK
ncbi:MAG TPA: aminotransferase class I/II-fold pyridoxal phosphate-dependent enzyme, partial [Bacteroidetes bacterium]|nr:aminotransferase class I/II-fold pyridoxal phosphate-dependent enzyme [Bacteroidota bacterium]